MKTHSLDHLRQTHPQFHYLAYKVAWHDGDLTFSFDFAVDPAIRFAPQVTIKDVDPERVRSLGPGVLDNMAFHLGLMEMPSYWKATCSPEIVVHTGALDEYQTAWWKDLLIHGQGEFFYLNDIDFSVPDFVTLTSHVTSAPLMPYESALNTDKVLVPMGGGKDSAVTLELFKSLDKAVTCWCLNPTPSVLECIEVGGGPNLLVVKRKIDPTLLRLNAEGYLNGHTPFSAYLAFLSSICSVLFDYGNIAVSNERSSNEGTAHFHGVDVNHQYSKSFDFEHKFRQYSQKYLGQSVNYFSSLRPLYELQIAKLFAGYPQYFPVFRSCNKGQKNNSWCSNCPKCLFVAALLYPFVDESSFATIFAANPFANAELIETAFSLLGQRESKPFECVGTKEETLVAFHLSVQKARATGQPLPIVLQTVEEQVLAQQHGMEERTHEILSAWNDQNALPADFEALLRDVTRGLAESDMPVAVEGEVAEALARSGR